ncbi:unnamed protein product [Leptosia nina]|uniref:Inosine/uridine-preferring nucleoside hydrolase domain-containing protein n=1 Tax=Leptosia nina TaxID=320188 RepID=A0AAV1JJG4_9NEOP
MRLRLLKIGFVYLFIVSMSTANAFGPKLIIDHDGGADDAMAIFMALLNEKYFNGPKIVAISTVHGNVNESQAFQNTQRILSIAGRRDIPIYRGAGSALVIDVPTDRYFGIDGLGDNDTTKYEPIEAQSDVAAIALINLSKKYSDALTIVTLGPLTNIALAVKLDPDFISRISQAYIAAGYVYTNGLTKIEFNVKLDVEAYYIVIENGSSDQITLIPSSQIKQYLNVGRKWRRDTFGVIDTDIVRSLNDFERISMAQSKDWNLLDPAAMALVLEPSLVLEKKLTRNKVYLCGKLRGKTSNDFKTKSPNARLVYSADKDAYQDFLMKIFSAEINDQSNGDTSNENNDNSNNDNSANTTESNDNANGNDDENTSNTNDGDNNN